VTIDERLEALRQELSARLERTENQRPPHMPTPDDLDTFRTILREELRAELAAAEQRICAAFAAACEEFKAMLRSDLPPAPPAGL
jgi:hypothetical protein